MTGDRDQRALETPRHVFDKRVLPQPVGPLRMTGRSRGVRSFKEIHFPADGQVIRLGCDSDIPELRFQAFIPSILTFEWEDDQTR